MLRFRKFKGNKWGSPRFGEFGVGIERSGWKIYSFEVGPVCIVLHVVWRF